MPPESPYGPLTQDDVERLLTPLASRLAQGDAALFDDLLQEGRIKLWNKMAGHDPAGMEAVPYARTVARQAMVDELRRQRRHLPVDVEIDDLQIPAAGGNPEAALDLARVEARVLRLAPPLRAAIDREIGPSSPLPAGSSEARAHRRHRARARLELAA